MENYQIYFSLINYFLISEYISEMNMQKEKKLFNQGQKIKELEDNITSLSKEKNKYISHLDFNTL